MKSIDRRFSTRWILLCIYTILPAICHSQNTPTYFNRPVGLPFSFNKAATVSLKSASISQICDILHKKYDLDFMMNGAPRVVLHPVNANGTVWQVLDQVGKIFDYSWKYHRTSELIILVRDFSRMTDAPQTNLPEMQRMASLITNTLASSVPLPPTKDLLIVMAKNAIRTLGPMQATQLKQPHGVAIGGMPPASQMMFENLVESALIYPAYYEWSRIEYILAHPASWTIEYSRFQRNVNNVVSPRIQLTFVVPIPGEVKYRLPIGEYPVK